MKLVAGLLLMAALPVAAQTLTMENKAGGQIVLTNRPCFVQGTEYEKLRAAYAFGEKRDAVVIGCWRWMNTEVIVVWKTPGGAEWKVYKLASFQGSE